MPFSVQSFLTYAVAVVSAGEIKFSANTNAASLSVSCETSSPSFSVVSPKVVPQTYEHVVDAYLSNVAPTCTAYKAGVPCANHSSAFPPQFYCEWTGSEGTYQVGPLSAMTKPYAVEGVIQKMEVYVPCPTPPHDTVTEMTGFGGLHDPDDPEVLHLKISYGDSNTTMEEIAFDGVPGGNYVEFSNLFEPPSPPSPPQPPMIPPPYCVDAHNTLTFSYAYEQNVGCRYQSGNSIRYRSYGSKTWNQCILLSSNYGAMMVPTAYAGYGWYAHRKNTQASTWQGSWASIYMRALTSTIGCILGRRTTHYSTYDNDLEGASQKLDDDGNLWTYKDFGPMYYDECITNATTVGGNMITPYTIGFTQQTGSYWRMSSKHSSYCNSFQWVTSAGTSLGYTYLSSLVRSQTDVNCMVGFIECEPDDRSD